MQKETEEGEGKVKDAGKVQTVHLPTAENSASRKSRHRHHSQICLEGHPSGIKGCRNSGLNNLIQKTLS